ncbi:hypothetical protein KBA63_01795 [Candidatus Woesebacteria bacterium]|nr:hypothetical protein [Candidatus Woesebacteria bacterium]
MLDQHSQIQLEGAAVNLLRQQGIEAHYDEESGVIVLPRNDRALPSQMAAILEYLFNLMNTQNVVLDSNPRTRADLIRMFISTFKMLNMDIEYDEVSGTLVVPSVYEPVGVNQLTNVLKYILFLSGHQSINGNDGVVSFTDKFGINQIEILVRD